MHLFFWTLLFIHRWRNPCSSRNLEKWLSERGSRLNKPIGRYISGNRFKLAFVIPTVFVWYSWILHVVFVVSPTVVPEYYMLCLTNCFCASVLQVGIWLCCDIKLILCGMLQFCVAISHQMWLYINFTGGHFVYGMHRFYRLQYNTVFVWYASIIAHLLFLYGMHQFYKWGISLGYHQMICVVCFNFTECFF